MSRSFVKYRHSMVLTALIVMVVSVAWVGMSSRVSVAAGASLSLVKTVANDNGGTAVASDWDLSAGANTVTGSATPVVVTHIAGTYELTETEVDGYSLTSLTCDDDPGVEVTSVKLGVFESVTCTFVNDDDDPGASVIRLAGATRYETAVVISARFYGPGVDAVYVTRGDNFPDGLAGAPAAAVMEPGPILLSHTSALPGAVEIELTRLQPKKIYILGGSDVVSDHVASQLAAYTTGPVERLDGRTRYETAVAISSRFFSSVRNGNPYAFIARGDAFPDALAGGPLAAMRDGPMLLVRPDSIPEAVGHELDSLQLTEGIYILGGTDVVSPGVEASLAARGIPVIRLAGQDRYETAQAIYDERAGDWNHVAFVATGLDFPDALAGGAPAGMLNAPLFLVQTDSIPDATAAALTDLKPGVIFILGGTDVVTDNVATQLAAFITPGAT